MAQTAARYENEEYVYATGTYGGAAAVPARAPRETERPRERPRERERVREEPSWKARISVAAVLSFFFVAGLMAMLIYTNALITLELSDIYAEPSREFGNKKVGLNAELEALREEKRELDLRFERTFELTAVEKIAAERLGMVRAAPSLGKSRVTVPDKAVVHGEAATGKKFETLLIAFSGLFD
ncbi:MAG: hypothetical protein LBS90_04775 [Oscillospiraceae bacterium]|jgi:hypothetical protein|nr:hypothetical protein [Oscillospiraceae bacterium]